MSVNVGGMLVLGVLIVVLTVMARADIVSTTLVGHTMGQAVDRAGEKARTAFVIWSVGPGTPNLTVNVKNTGTTSVYDYPHMDFIVAYTEVGGTQVIGRLTYTEGPLGNNQWHQSAITPSVFEPGAWNPGDIMTLDAKLDPSQKVGTRGRLSVATPNGVVDTTPFPPIVFDAASSAEGSGSVLSWTHTVTGLDTYLWVGIANNKKPVISATYAGEALTFLDSEFSGKGSLEVWYKVGPQTGANDIVVTTAASAITVAGATSWTGVHQVTPMGTPVFEKHKSGNPSETITSAVGELIVDAIVSDGASGLPTVGAPQTQRWNLQNATDTAFFGAGSSAQGAPAVTMSWTTDGDAVIGVVALKPSP